MLCIVITAEVHAIWFLQRMGFVQHEGGTIPCTVKTMRQLTCTDRPYKANHQISFGASYSTCTYCTVDTKHSITLFSALGVSLGWPTRIRELHA